MNRHISEQYDTELADIKARLMEMGGLVEQQLERGARALITHDVELAESMNSTENQINKLEVDLDEQCVQVIARRQPTAGDLRTLICVMRAITDLERIGDEAHRIARMARGMAREELPEDQYGAFRELNSMVARQLASALDAFARLDEKLANEVIQGDEVIDNLYRNIISSLKISMADNPNHINRSMNVIWAARALERIGDHAKNLGEYVMYRVKGEDVRHAGSNQ